MVNTDNILASIQYFYTHFIVNGYPVDGEKVRSKVLKGSIEAATFHDIFFNNQRFNCRK